MKAIKIRKKVNACAFLRTLSRRCEIFLLRHGRGGRARRRGGAKNVGAFFENKGTFRGKWGGKGEKPRAFRIGLGRRARGLWERARREGALGVRRGGRNGCTAAERAHGLGERARRGGALAGRSGVGSDARRRKGALAREGVGAPWPKGRAGGGGARNNAYLCGRLTDFFLLHRTLFL